MKVPEFDKEYRDARRAAFGQCTARLQQGSTAAAIQTTLLYVQVTPQDVYLQYARAVSKRIHRPPVISS